jgi:hypothetical protein
LAIGLNGICSNQALRKIAGETENLARIHEGMYVAAKQPSENRIKKTVLSGISGFDGCFE